MLVLQGGRVIDPSQDLDTEADVFVDGGAIVDIVRRDGSSPPRHPSANDQAIDCSNHWVVPGLIDLWTEIREPGDEYKETLTETCQAALAGGFTTIAVAPETRPPVDCCEVAQAIQTRVARLAAAPNVLPMAHATVGGAGTTLTEMHSLAQSGVFAVYAGADSLPDARMMRSALKYAQMFNLVFFQHPEDASLSRGGHIHEGTVSSKRGLKARPREAEAMVLSRDLALCRLVRTAYHARAITTEEGVHLIRQAKESGLPVSCSVTPHHLWMTEDAISTHESKAKMLPPLREQRDVDALRKALAGGIVDCVVSAHAPQAGMDQECPIEDAAFGSIGLETALPLMLRLVDEGVLSAPDIVRALSQQPARVAGLDKGSLEPGKAADITVINPHREWTPTPDSLHSRAVNTPWLHQTFTGVAQTTIVSGKVVFER